MSDRWQQIEDLYHAALEDRAVLDKADPALRQEVESLLARENAAGRLPKLWRRRMTKALLIAT
jgi:hypothetical protein